LEALQSREVEGAALTGAGRSYAMRVIYTNNRPEIDAIPMEIRRLILEHVRQVEANHPGARYWIGSKVERLVRAFQIPPEDMPEEPGQ